MTLTPRAWVASGVLLLVAAACATSPLGRRQLILVSDAQLQEMGASAFEQMKSEGKVSSDSKVNNYVTCVARHITQALPASEGGAVRWEVRVFDDDSANAFALPGQKIGVHTGLLKVAKNQHQLATVIGHEVAHVLANHSGERVSQQVAAQGLTTVLGAAGDPSSPLNAVVQQALGVGVGVGLMAYGRSQESEADKYGLDLMARAGFDPREAVTLWQNMAAASEGNRPPEFLSTHPSPESRIRELQVRAKTALPLAEQAWAAGRKPSCG